MRKRENEALKLNFEISVLEQEINNLQLSLDQNKNETIDYTVLTSTPTTIKRKLAKPLDERRRKRLPPRPEYFGESNFSEIKDNISHNNFSPPVDRFVTYRRKNTQQPPKLDISQKILCMSN
jgi:hypothetical protein